MRSFADTCSRRLIISSSTGTRKKHTVALPETEPRDPRGGEPEAPLLEQERQDVLKRCIDKLEYKLAELVRARMRGESYESICQQMGLDPARAHRMFHQAKEELTGCVERSFR